MTFQTGLNTAGGLPDPDRDARFYAGVPGKRLLAFLIDIAAVWGLSLIVGVLTLGIGFFLFGLVIAFVDLLYRVTTLSGRSATLGMRVMGIELRDSAGERLEFGGALLHTVLYYVAVAFVVLQLISILLMLGSRYGRGLHDALLGTAMINRPL